MEKDCIDWLLAGDPSVRWQTMRDLLDVPLESVEQERARVALAGWGSELLQHQDPDGNWGKGIYNPKWKSTTYTLLLLRQLGLPAEHPQALRGCAQFFFRGLEKDGGINFFKNMSYSETCINGMLLTLLAYFRYPDERVHNVADYLLKEQMLDGGWNCRRIHGATHASFNTTISVLEGFLEYSRTYPQGLECVQPAITRGQEFLLQHHIYQSHHTGKPAKQEMTLMHFPPQWHFDFLRGLDYFQSIHAPQDERMRDAIDLLRRRQDSDGRWSSNKPWSGQAFFQIDTTGQASRWNTLRALRVLKWWGNN